MQQLWNQEGNRGENGEEKEEAARYKESGETSLAASRKVVENRADRRERGERERHKEWAGGKRVSKKERKEKKRDREQERRWGSYNFN